MLSAYTHTQSNIGITGNTCGEGQTEKADDQDGHHNHDGVDQDTVVMELDAELEDDLCKLWDASINEVSK